MKTITVLPNNEIKYVKSIICFISDKYPAAYRRYRCCSKEWQDVLACIY